MTENTKSRQRIALACFFISSCTADFRCDPSLSYVSGPDADAVPPVGCVECTPIELSAGAFHTALVTRDYATYGWGDNRHGQLGPGPETVLTPTRLTVGRGTPVHLAAGTAHTCVHDFQVALGRIECFGLNLSGVTGPFLSSHAEFAVGRYIFNADFGAAHGVALLDQQPLRSVAASWGDNRFHQLGTSSSMTNPIPTVGDAYLDQIAAGGYATCRTDGDVLSCSGTLALTETGYEADAASDERIVWDGFTPLDDVPPIEAMSIGMAHLCVIDEDGAVFCLGANQSGESGEEDPLSPGFVRRIELPGPAIAISAGGGFEVARVGTHPSDYDLMPRGAGAAHTCAIVGHAEGARLYCWGDNRYGQLGDGTRESRGAPRAVALPSFVTAVVTGAHHTCVLDEESVVWCWGDNRRGQLGRSPEEWESSEFPLRVNVAGEDP